MAKHCVTHQAQTYKTSHHHHPQNHLQVNQFIESIDLGDNRIDDVGLAALREAFVRNTSVTDLDLSHNKFSDAAGAVWQQRVAAVMLLLLSID